MACLLEQRNGESCLAVLMAWKEDVAGLAGGHTHFGRAVYFASVIFYCLFVSRKLDNLKLVQSFLS